MVGFYKAGKIMVFRAATSCMLVTDGVFSSVGHEKTSLDRPFSQHTRTACAVGQDLQERGCLIIVGGQPGVKSPVSYGI